MVMTIMSLRVVPRILRNVVLRIAKPSHQCNQAFPFHGSRQKLKKRCQGSEEYYTRLANAKDHEAVMRVMRDTYLKFEPSIVNLGLSGCDVPALSQIIHQGLKEGMTIVAVRSEDDGVIGAAINTGSCPWGPDHLVRYANCCESGAVKELLKFYAFVCRQPQLWQKYRVLKIFECTYVTVANECQGNGIAKRLIRDSWYLARDCGYRLFRIDCTSRYTAKIAEGLGWKCVWSFPYERYTSNGQPVFKCVQEPHTKVDVFVDQVRFCKDYCSPYPAACKKPKKKSPTR